MDENMKAFVEYGSNLDMESQNPPAIFIIALLFGLPGCFIPYTPLMIIICIVTTIIIVLITGIYCKKNKNKKGITFLYCGTVSLSLTLIFFFETLCIILYLTPKGKKLFIMSVISLLYMVVIICYYMLIRLLIKKGSYKSNGKTVLPVLIYFFGIMGMCGAGAGVGKYIIGENEQNQGFMVIALGCIIISLACMLGVTNLIKYYYYIKINN